MIIIKRSVNKKFYVVVTGDNNEILSTSELLNTKQAAYKNIYAQEVEFLAFELEIQDDTLKKKK